jgi:hypothetical protein
MTGYQPMTLAALARHLAAAEEPSLQWDLVWEFLQEYRWADHLGLTTVAEVLAVCAKVFPDERVPARSILKLEDLFGVGG